MPRTETPWVPTLLPGQTLQRRQYDLTSHLACGYCTRLKQITIVFPVKRVNGDPAIAMNPHVLTCPGNDQCSYGPDGGPALPCRGWGDMCCTCGANYAQGQR